MADEDLTRILQVITQQLENLQRKIMEDEEDKKDKIKDRMLWSKWLCK